MENKSFFNLEIKELESDEKNYIFEGHAAVFNNKDYGAEIILPGSFEKSLAGAHKVKILWQHDKKQPVGVPQEIREDATGLYVKGIMPKDDVFVKERVMPQMRIGSLELSIGYKTLDRDFKDNAKYIKEVFLGEVSLVSMGMNNKAQIINYKSLDIDSIKNLNERDLEKMFKDGFVASNNVAKLLVSAIKKINDQRDVGSLSVQRDAEMANEMKNITYKRMLDDISKIKNKNKE